MSSGAAEAVDVRVWLGELAEALVGDADLDVPCGDCTACCTSSQFVHIGPDEAAPLASIPAELLFPAPGLPAGHQLMGYDERGHCPMLIDGACSVYDTRPRTCRTYDCRVFTVTGVEPDDQPDVAAASRRWSFGPGGANTDTAGRRLIDRVRSAVDPEVVRPLDRALRAVGPIAVELHGRGTRFDG